MATKKIKCGIMDREAYINRTMRIARGEYSPDKDEPKIWFESIETLAQVLNRRNLKLLQVIEDRKPHSITALAHETGRAKGNLSRTLKKMESYGLVSFEQSGRNKRPVALGCEFEISYGRKSLVDETLLSLD